MEKFEIQLWEAPQLVIESWTETEEAEENEEYEE